MVIDDHMVDERRSEIIRVYFDQLHDMLKKLNFRSPMPALLDLQLSILRATPLDLLNALVFIPPRFLNYRKVVFSEYLDDTGKALNNFADKVHDMPEYREYLLKRLRRLELAGVID